MFNEELTQKILAEHGRQAAMIYCKIEAMKNRHMSVELIERNIQGWPDEYKYEGKVGCLLTTYNKGGRYG